MQSVRPVFNVIRSQVRNYHGVREFKPPHMNELPTPTGSWQRLNEQRQRKYNTTLLVGAAIFSVSLYTFFNCGIRFNRYAPEHYE